MLNDLLKKELLEYLFDNRMSCMFGDGLESEYIMDGCNMIGLNQMTDEQLVEEYMDIVQDDSDEFFNRLLSDIESQTTD